MNKKKNTFFIAIVIEEDSKLLEQITTLIASKESIHLSVYSSLTELYTCCHHIIDLIVTNLKQNQFHYVLGVDFIFLKDLNFNTLEVSLYQELDAFLAKEKQLKKSFKDILKETQYYIELNGCQIDFLDIDTFIFALINQFFFNFSFGFKIEMGVILKEGLLNAFIHGNFDIDSDIKESENGFEKFNALVLKKQQNELFCLKKVLLEIVIQKNKVIISIEDEGKGFNYKVLPEDDLKCYGRGIKLIEFYSEHLHWNDKGNKIIIEKHYD